LPLQHTWGDFTPGEPLLVSLPRQRFLALAIFPVEVLWCFVVIHIGQLLKRRSGIWSSWSAQVCCSNQGGAPDMILHPATKRCFRLI
jgi:hypothetical protein